MQFIKMSCLQYIWHYICDLSYLTEPAAATSNQVDLFGESLIGDLMDAPSVPAETLATNGNSSEVDLFADATFVSAPPQVEKGASSQSQVITFSSQFLKVKLYMVFWLSYAH